jgi:hypothetical protein
MVWLQGAYEGALLGQIVVRSFRDGVSVHENTLVDI